MDKLIEITVSYFNEDWGYYYKDIYIHKLNKNLNQFIINIHNTITCDCNININNIENQNICNQCYKICVNNNHLLELYNLYINYFNQMSSFFELQTNCEYKISKNETRIYYYKSTENTNISNINIITKNDIQINDIYLLFCADCIKKMCNICQYNFIETYEYEDENNDANNYILYNIKPCNGCINKLLYDYKCSCNFEYGKLCLQLDNNEIPDDYSFGHTSNISFNEITLNNNNDIIYEKHIRH